MESHAFLDMEGDRMELLLHRKPLSKEEYRIVFNLE